MMPKKIAKSRWPKTYALAWLPINQDCSSWDSHTCTQCLVSCVLWGSASSLIRGGALCRSDSAVQNAIPLQVHQLVPHTAEGGNFRCRASFSGIGSPDPPRSQGCRSSRSAGPLCILSPFFFGSHSSQMIASKVGLRQRHTGSETQTCFGHETKKTAHWRSRRGRFVATKCGLVVFQHSTFVFFDTP